MTDIWDDLLIDFEYHINSWTIGITTLLTTHDINEEMNTLTSSITNTLNKHLPYHSLTKKQRKLKAHPWIIKGYPHINENKG